jgi:glucokinase
MRIIAGDIGGTKTLLQLVELEGSAQNVVAERRFASGDYRTFDDLLREFLGPPARGVVAACFAVAGPVLENRAEVTNLQWLMETAALQSGFAIPRVALINDFYAVALGVPFLADADMIALNAGTPNRTAPIAILGAGTGLGEAMLFWTGTRWEVVPSEGGHGDFGPQDELQARLFLALHAKYGHVSWERVASGMGLQNIYEFLGGGEATAAEISNRARAGDALALQTFAIFVDIYGAEAGNMALRILSRGGVFLAGGVAAKNVEHFTDGRFMTAFLRKGRFTDVMAAMPVRLITNERVGLLGAVEMARRIALESAQHRSG